MALPPLESWYCKGCEIFFLRIKWSRLESFYEQREISIYIYNVDKVYLEYGEC
jgi:hypothetical protein